MTRTVDFRSTPTPQLVPPLQDPSTPRQIVIDLDNLQEYCGIKPDDKIIDSWMKDTTLDTITSAELLALPPTDSRAKFLHGAPIAITFRDAVEFIVNLINDDALEHPQEKEVLCHLSGASPECSLFCSLTNVRTLRPDLVPNPPKYAHPYCSASPSANNSWLGVVLRMLLDNGHISAYGDKGGQFWVNI